jgi:hypothetical protein
VNALGRKVGGVFYWCACNHEHVLPGMQEKASAKLEAILFGR